MAAELAVSRMLRATRSYTQILLYYCYYYHYIVCVAPASAGHCVSVQRARSVYLPARCVPIYISLYYRITVSLFRTLYPETVARVFRGYAP